MRKCVKGDEFNPGGPWTAADAGECLASALIASAAACTENHKETELFLRHVAMALMKQAGAAGPNASAALRLTAVLLEATEPPPAMCAGNGAGVRPN